MRWTQTLIPTTRDTPEGAKATSHVLMLRAGLIAQAMGGVYSYLPLGLRARQKAEHVVREQLEAVGAVEMALPAMTPAALWEQSRRAESLGERLIRFSVPRPGREARVVLAPADEEAITDLIARCVGSYRQLPLLLYQMASRFHGEPRPRLGLLYCSEFQVHEAYSFDVSAESLDESYEKIHAAYRRVLDRCRLKFLSAESDGGMPGGEAGHILAIAAEAGEDLVLHCPDCGYVADRQHAEIGPADSQQPPTAPAELKQVDTPGATTIEQVSAMLDCQPREMIKTLIYVADEQPVAVLIRGDREASEEKIRRALEAETLEMADFEVTVRVTGAPVGFAGPVGMKEKIPVWADREIRHMVNAVTGANAADAHLTGVNYSRDFLPDRVADLRIAVTSDPCPRCSSTLTLRRAIQVGRLSKVGTRYSDALAARFDDADEQQRPIVMGSYWLGIDRLLAAVVESSHDESGIIWPVALAPYEVLLVSLAAHDPIISGLAERLHDELSAAGIDVLLDDRDARPGVKFNDADLIGIPLRVVIGQRGLKQEKLEAKWRWDEGPRMIDLTDAAGTLAEMIRSHR